MRKGQVILLGLIVVSLLSSACSYWPNQYGYYNQPIDLEFIVKADIRDVPLVVEEVLHDNGYKILKDLSFDNIRMGEKNRNRLQVIFYDYERMGEISFRIKEYDKSIYIKENGYYQVDVRNTAKVIKLEIEKMLAERKEVQK